MKTLEKILSYTQENNGCLEWTRCFNTDGYPRMGWKGSSNGKVHRIVAELSGQDVEGKIVRHKCDNPKCINPEHLITGTVADNARDMDDRGRRYKKIDARVIEAVISLWNTGKFTKTEIAKILCMDQRRICEITLGKRDTNGKIVRQ